MKTRESLTCTALACLWVPSAAVAGSKLDCNINDVTITDDGRGIYVHSPITISAAPAGAVVTQIDYTFLIIHADGRDLDVDLNDHTRTSAYKADLWRGTFAGGTNSGSNPSGASTITSGPLIGLPVNQTWYLAAADVETPDQGYIDVWCITVYWNDPICTDSQCGACERCQNNACAAVSCPSGQRCNNNHGCEPIPGYCSGDSGCGACQRCQNNACTAVSCPTGQRCNNNHGCEATPGYCSSDSGCGACERCQNNACAAVSCPSGQRCNNNHGCEPTTGFCSSDAGCAACERCQSNSCLPVSCPSGQECNNNHGCATIDDGNCNPSTTRLAALGVAQYANGAGFRGDDLVIAIAVARAESDFIVGAWCEDCLGVQEDSRGLWQINIIAHPEFARTTADACRLLTDPESNAAAAFSLFQTPNGWRHWSAYTSGTYAQYLTEARAAAEQVDEVSPPPPSTANGFDWPFGSTAAYSEAYDGDGWYSAQDFKEFNSDNRKYHLGEDWNLEGVDDCGEEVYAAGKGTVVFAASGTTTCGQGTGWGKVLILRHTLPNGGAVETLYGHLRSFAVTSGVVERSQLIGYVGDGDGLYPCHLHFEVRFSNCPSWGCPGPGYWPTQSPVGWADPSDFIENNRPGSPSQIGGGIPCTDCDADGVPDGMDDCLNPPTPPDSLVDERGCEIECLSAVDCDDTDPCTDDSCVNGQCLSEEIRCSGGEVCVDGSCSCPRPSRASSPSPTNNATSVVPTRVQLSWDPSSSADSYDVYVGTDSTPDAGEFLREVSSGEQTTVDGLRPDTRYFWRVDAVNDCEVTEGSVWSFLTTRGAADPDAGQDLGSNDSSSGPSSPNLCGALAAANVGLLFLGWLPLRTLSRHRRPPTRSRKKPQ